MTRTTIKQIRQVVVAAALMALAFAPAAFADLAVQHDSSVFLETAGNGNAIPEPGDTVAVTENVVSFDDMNMVLGGVSGTLTSASADVTIPSASSPYADLVVGWPTPNTNAYSVKLSNSMECGVNVPLTLSLTTSAGSGDITFGMPTGRAGAWASADSAEVPREIPDSYPNGVSSSLGVGGSSRVKGLRVRIGQLTHTYDGDLTITPIAPDGRSVKLVDRKGGNGDNFTNTVFDDNGASINSGAPPYTGSYRPAEPLSSLDGAPLNGTWTLKVVDNSSGEIGTIDAWGIDAAPAVCDPQPTPTPTPPVQDPPPPPKTQPHDCGQHNGNGNAFGLQSSDEHGRDGDCPDHADDKGKNDKNDKGKPADKGKPDDKGKKK
jgi:subtilisin-like proprotein convertase family protein